MKKQALLELRDIPFCDFQRFLVDGELSVLGTGSEDALLEHSEKLLQQYQDLIGAGEDNERIFLANIVQSYQAQLLIVQACIDLLAIGHHQDIVEILKNEGFDYDFSPESYKKDLEKVLSEAKSIVARRDQAQIELEGYGEGKSADYEYFSDILAAISKIMGFSVDDRISTLQFCAYHKRLIEHYRRLQLNQAKQSSDE